MPITAEVIKVLVKPNIDIMKVVVKPEPTTVILTGSTIFANKNVGVGEGIYKGMDGNIAEFHTMSGGTGTNIYLQDDTLVFESSAAGDFVSTVIFTGYTATTETRLEGIESDVTGNTALIDINTSGITDNAADITYLSGATDLLEIQVTGNTDAITINKNDIQLVSGVTESNFNLITGNTELINTLSGETINKLDSVQEGTNIVIDNTDPLNPIINVSGVTTEDIYVSGSTLTGEDLVLSRTEGQPDLTTDLSPLTSQLETDLDTVSGQTDTNTINIANNTTGITKNYNDIQALSATSVIYDAPLDAYHLPPTLDGQVQDLGRELFVDVFNPSLIPTTSLDPEVFLVTDAYSSVDKVLNTIRPLASDISTGAVFGINTVDANANSQFKITVFGYVSGVNTSAWGVNTILYVDPLIAGRLTDIKPITNIYPIARVEKQDALNGALAINTFGAVQESGLAPATFNQAWFTGDIATGTTGTYYLVDSTSKGIIPEVIESIVVPDNSIVAIGQDSVTDNPTTEIVIGSGVYTGQVEFTINNVGGNEKIYLEVYKADTAGVPIDSGIVFEPIGDLGVRPMLTMTTALMNADNAYTIFANLSGTLTENVTLLSTERIRYHFLAEKIGTIGGNKTFDIYFGSDHQTFVNIPQALELNDLLDVDVQGAVAGNVLKKNASGLWNGGSVTIGEIQDLQTELDGKLDLTGNTRSGSTQFSGDIWFGNPNEEPKGFVGESPDRTDVMGIGGLAGLELNAPNWINPHFSGSTGAFLTVGTNGLINLTSQPTGGTLQWSDTGSTVAIPQNTATPLDLAVIPNQDVDTGSLEWNINYTADNQDTNITLQLLVNGVPYGDGTQYVVQSNTTANLFGSTSIKNQIASGDTLNVQLTADRAGTVNNSELILQTGGDVTAQWGSITGDITDQTDLQLQFDTKSSKALLTKAISADYTVLETDNGLSLECINNPTITFPLGLSIGFQTMVTNIGTGSITIFSNGTLESNGTPVITNQFGAATVYHRGSDVHIAFGDFVAGLSSNGLPLISSEDELAGRMELAVVSVMPPSPSTSTIYFVTS